MCLFCVVKVNGDIPPRLKKSAHEVILEFIRSRPPLNPVRFLSTNKAGSKSDDWCSRFLPPFAPHLLPVPYVNNWIVFCFSCNNLHVIHGLPQVSARKLKPQAQAPPTLHERILEEIKAERKLRPVSPGEVRRAKLGTNTCDAHTQPRTQAFFKPHFSAFALCNIRI